MSDMRRRSESGATLVEYGLILALGATAWLFTVQMIGIGLKGWMEECVVTELESSKSPAWCGW